MPRSGNNSILGLTKIVNSVNFDGIDDYKYGLCVDNNNYGVLRFIFGVWEWSWMNTINSNITCIHFLINYYNHIKNYPMVSYNSVINNYNVII